MELELLEARKKAAEIKLQKCRFNLQKKVQENKLTDEELFMTKELNYSNFKTLAKELADNNWKRYYLIDDIRRDIFKERDLIELIENYEQKIIIETAKNNVVEIPVLRKFLEDWKNEAVNFYLEHAEKFEKEYDDSFAIQNYEEAKNRRSFLYKKYGALIINFALDYNGSNRAAKIVEVCNKEAKNKYIDLVQKITHVVGKIKNCTNLEIADSGDINGKIFGEKASATIQTITAGGWNIQCAHFRVLIHKVF